MTTEIISGRGEGYILKIKSGFDEEHEIIINPESDVITLRFNGFLRVECEQKEFNNNKGLIDFKTKKLKIITHDYK